MVVVVVVVVVVVLVVVVVVVAVSNRKIRNFIPILFLTSPQTVA